MTSLIPFLEEWPAEDVKTFTFDSRYRFLASPQPFHYASYHYSDSWHTTQQTVYMLELVSLHLPNVWKTIHSNNCHVDFQIDGSTKTATLTQGTYTLTDLLTELGTQMTTATASAQTITAAVGTGGFVTVTATGGGASNLKFLWATGSHATTMEQGSDDNQLSNMLGMGLSTNGVRADDTGTSLSRTGTAQPDLVWMPYVYIAIEPFALSDPLALSSNSGPQYTFRIPVDTSSGEIQHYDPQKHGRQIFVSTKPRTMSDLDVRLLDQGSNDVSTLNVDWTMVVRAYLLPDNRADQLKYTFRLGLPEAFLQQINQHAIAAGGGGGDDETSEPIPPRKKPRTGTLKGPEGGGNAGLTREQIDNGGAPVAKRVHVIPPTPRRIHGENHFEHKREKKKPEVGDAPPLSNALRTFRGAMNAPGTIKSRLRAGLAGFQGIVTPSQPIQTATPSDHRVRKRL